MQASSPGQPGSVSKDAEELILTAKNSLVPLRPSCLTLGELCPLCASVSSDVNWR